MFLGSLWRAKKVLECMIHWIQIDSYYLHFSLVESTSANPDRMNS